MITEHFAPGFRLFDGSQLNALVAQANALGVPLNIGTQRFVSATGSDAQNGLSAEGAFATIQHAIDASSYGDVILIGPGSYDEALTIDRPSIGSAGLFILGLGGPGAVGVAPTAVNATALTNHADDVTVVNVGLAGVGTGHGLTNTGSRLRTSGCKLENDDGTGICAQMTMGTVAQIAAHTRGKGADCKLMDGEFAWAASGVLLTCTDYGAVTELQVQGNWFHDLDTKHIYESVGAGGSAAVTYASLKLLGNVHQNDEAGTQPTDYVLLNANNANSGIMAGCVFPQAANGGKVLLSTKLISVGNFFTGGISTGQPS